MKITKLDHLDHLPCRILLVRETGDLEGQLPEQELHYITERLSSDKTEVKLLRPGSQLLVKKLPGTEMDLRLRMEEARKAGHALHAALNELEVTAVGLHNVKVSPEESLAFAEGLALSNYQFLKYLSKADELQYSLRELGIQDPVLSDQQVTRLNHVLEGVYQARDLVNEPLSYLTAEQLASEFERMGKEGGFDVEVFNKKKIESLKMGGLLAVNLGSVDPPTFTVMTWKPDHAINKKPLVLVGKGVVYDTGGMSLKPTLDSMDYMKCDMGGAAAVGGAMLAAALNQLPLWIIALVPATDNRVDGNAYVPGDVITMYNGSTVEVLNTDAEGRLILADALSYAKKFDPELVIELSTLTGSAHAAIDKYGIVGMGNAGREVMENLKESGEYTCERIAEFPFWDEYKEQLKSDVADLKNIGGRYGGAITAGKFLEHFTDYPYIHLDIAGPSFNKMPFNYRGKGGSGVGVRVLHHYFLSRSM